MDTTTEYLENIDGYKVAIAEAQRVLNGQNASIAAAKNIVEKVFAASSLVVGLGAALGIFHAETSAEMVGLYNLLIVVIAAMYLVHIALSVWVMQPIEFHAPIRAEWDVIYQHLVNQPDEKSVLKSQLSCYLNAIQLNDAIIFKRCKQAKWVSMIFPGIVVLMFILSLI